MDKRLNSLMFNTNLNTFNVGVSGSNPEQVTEKRFIDSFYKPFLCIVGKCCRANIESTAPVDPVEYSVNKLCQGAFTPYIR